MLLNYKSIPLTMSKSNGMELEQESATQLVHFVYGGHIKEPQRDDATREAS